MSEVGRVKNGRRVGELEVRMRVAGKDARGRRSAVRIDILI